MSVCKSRWRSTRCRQAGMSRSWSSGAKSRASKTITTLPWDCNSVTCMSSPSRHSFGRYLESSSSEKCRISQSSMMPSSMTIPVTSRELLSKSLQKARTEKGMEKIPMKNRNRLPAPKRRMQIKRKIATSPPKRRLRCQLDPSQVSNRSISSLIVAYDNIYFLNA